MINLYNLCIFLVGCLAIGTFVSILFPESELFLVRNGAACVLGVIWGLTGPQVFEVKK